MRKRKAESGKRINVSESTARRFGRRRAFTLVELLVTISILSILAATIGFASFKATQAARRDTTRARVNAISSLLMERYHSYTTRRVPIDVSGMNGMQSAAARLNGTRLLMMLEMPERWDEVGMNVAQEFRTSLYYAYARRKVAATPTIVHEGAECLYMIVMLGTADGEARTLFRENDIGDVDKDGAPEFLDGWGRPIHFIRWPAGFPSEIQPYLYDNGGTPAVFPPNAQTEDHDPFDVYRVDPVPFAQIAPPYNGPPRAFRLVPLVYSAGLDGDGDLNNGQVMDPYLPDNDGRYSGQPYDSEGDGEEGWHDNIHNHLQDVK